MVRFFWDRGEGAGQGYGEFRPEDYGGLLARLAEATGAELAFHQEEGLRGPERTFSPIRVGNTRSGWGVVCEKESDPEGRAAEAAAEVVSRVFTADQDIASLAMEVADRYEELNFLYEMSARVGALLDEDEICDFLVREAAWLMNCERASIMAVDPKGGELRIRAAVGLPESISSDVTVKPGEGISGKVFESGHGIIVNEGDPMPAESLGVRELRRADCFLSVPLKITPEKHGTEEILGVFNLTRKRETNMFTASDLKLVSAVASTAATQIHNCRLINAERERRELEHELELAARIQLSLLPTEPLRVAGFEAGGHCKLARHVGGDLFDYWRAGEHLCLVVADVSGHDMGAALMATAFRSVVRSESTHSHSAAGLLAQVNRALMEDLVHSELFISAFYARVDLATRRAAFCRAGHPKPLLIGPHGESWLDTEGLLLGVSDAEDVFEERSVQLEPGSLLVLYTDGLSEAQDPNGDNFGAEGVRQAAHACLDQPAKAVAERIVGAARDHCGAGPLVDDMTALVVHIEDAEGQ